MFGGNDEKPIEILLRLRTPANIEKVDQLNQKTRLSPTGFSYRVDKPSEALDITIILDAEQWAAGYISYPRGLHNDGTGFTLRKARIPVNDVLRDLPRFIRSPRNHGGYPSSLLQLSRSHSYRGEQLRSAGRMLGRPMCYFCLVFDPLRGLPHTD